MACLYFPLDLLWYFFLICIIRYSSAQCGDSIKRDTSFDDVGSMYERFIKRYTGSASFVGEYPSGLASCRMDPLPPISASKDWIPIAVGPHDYIHSLMCGTCLKISPRKLKKRSIRNTTDEDIFPDNLKKPAIKTIVEDFQFNPTLTYYGTVVDQCVHCKTGDLEMYRDGSGAHEIIYEAIDCPDISGDKGFLRLRTRSCDEQNVKKIQIKNTRLPTISLELFQNNKWECLMRTKDNHFLLPSYDLPMKARITSITGQVVGFTIDSLESKRDFMIPAQYSSFENVATGKPPKLKCFIEGQPIPKEVNDDEYDLKKRNMTIDDLHKLPNNKHLLTQSGHLIHKEQENLTPVNLASLISSPLSSSPLNKVLDHAAMTSGKTIQTETKNPTSLNMASLISSPFTSKSHDSSSLNNAMEHFIMPNGHSSQRETKTPTSHNIASIISLPGSSMSHNSLHLNYDLNRVRNNTDGMNHVRNNTVNTHKQNLTNSVPNFINNTKLKDLLMSNQSVSRLKANHKNTLLSLIQNLHERPCINKLDGRYKTPDDCSSFYICQGGTQQIKKCPKGLLFNTRDTVCDWPMHVDCLQGLNTKDNLVPSYFDDDEVYTKKFIAKR